MYKLRGNYFREYNLPHNHGWMKFHKLTTQTNNSALALKGYPV